MKALETLEAYDSLVDTVYEAGEDPALWNGFLARLGALTGSRVYWGLAGYDLVANQKLSILSANFDPDSVASYEAYYSELNPWLPHTMRRAAGSVVTGRDVLDEADLLRTEFYNDWLLPQGDISRGAAGVLFNDSMRAVVLAANVSRRDNEETEKEVQRLIGLLTPHVQRALGMNRSLAAGKAGPGPEAGAAAFHLSSDGAVVSANAAATALLAGASALTLGYRGVLRVGDRLAQQRLERALGAITAGRFDPQEASFVIRRADGRPLAAEINPVIRDAGDPPMQGDCAIGQILSLALPVAMLTVTDPWMQNHLRRSAFASHYGLTTAETELAGALVTGRSLAEIADDRQVSPFTIKNQLRSLFAKTGTSRQGELIALIVRWLER